MFKRYLGKYNDLLLGLVLIPLINTINYHLTYTRIRWDWYTVTTYLIDTVTGWISWWIMRLVVLRMDRLLPYEVNPGRRIGLQLLYSTLLIEGFIIGTTWVINELFGDGPLPGSFYSYNLFIFFIWILVLNGIYIGFYFYDRWQSSQQQVQKERSAKSGGITVHKGRRVQTIPYGKIGPFHSKEGLTYLTSLEGERFVLDRSLSRIQEELPPSLFFRINRKFILHRDTLLGYHKESHGKLSLDLKAGFPMTERPVISRLTAPDFKQWLRGAGQHP